MSRRCLNSNLLTSHTHVRAQVRQFDDVIVSMMGLSGWLAVIYFFR